MPSSELTAGRELDALIAEKVMGVEPMLSWQVMSLDERSSVLSGTKDECERWLESHAKLFPISAYAGYHVGAWKHHPRYSIDISAAWQVVERVRKIIPKQTQTQAYSFQLCQLGIPGSWSCSFVVNDGDWSTQARVEGVATAPLAICLAALKAVSHAD